MQSLRVERAVEKEFPNLIILTTSWSQIFYMCILGKEAEVTMERSLGIFGGQGWEEVSRIYISVRSE